MKLNTTCQFLTYDYSDTIIVKIFWFEWNRITISIQCYVHTTSKQSCFNKYKTVNE